MSLSNAWAGYDGWLERPYHDQAEDEAEIEIQLEDAKWGLETDLRNGSLEDARKFAFDNLDEEVYQTVGRLLYEVARNPKIGKSPDFGVLVANMMDDLLDKIACREIDCEYTGNDWTQGFVK